MSIISRSIVIENKWKANCAIGETKWSVETDEGLIHGNLHEIIWSIIDIFIIPKKLIMRESEILSKYRDISFDIKTNKKELLIWNLSMNNDFKIVLYDELDLYSKHGDLLCTFTPGGYEDINIGDPLLSGILRNTLSYIIRYRNSILTNNVIKRIQKDKSMPWSVEINKEICILKDFFGNDICTFSIHGNFKEYVIQCLEVYTL